MNAILITLLKSDIHVIYIFLKIVHTITTVSTFLPYKIKMLTKNESWFFVVFLGWGGVGFFSLVVVAQSHLTLAGFSVGGIFRQEY